MKILAVIPSRLGSTRLPEKPLHNILGKPMIQHVYEGTRKSKLVDRVIVATDSDKIVDVVKEFGGEAMMTSDQHKTGTDRVIEVVESLEEKFDIIVNVQGDEPLVDGTYIDKLLKPLIDEEHLVSTPIIIAKEDEVDSPNVVKVVVDKTFNALYFSRSKIPFVRGEKPIFYKHVGVYAYKTDFLFCVKNWPQTMLEQSEMLEQLRILENGYKIKTVVWDCFLHGVDTIDDIKVVEEYMKGESK